MSDSTPICAAISVGLCIVLIIALAVGICETTTYCFGAPAAANHTIVLFPFGNVYGYNVSTSTCASVAPAYCNKTFQLACYDGAPAIDLPTAVPFNASLPVVGSLFARPIAATWADLMNATLATSIAGATGVQGPFWTGCSAGGVVATQNCGNWTVINGTASVGVPNSLAGATWLSSNVTANCTSSFNFLCGCLV